MLFEEAFEKDLGVLTTAFLKDVEVEKKLPDLETFKSVWKRRMFSGVHQAKARRLSWKECLQVLYATVSTKLRESSKEGGSKLLPVAYVYTLLCLYHTQPRNPLVNIRLRLSDFQLMLKLQSTHFCTLSGCTDAVAMLFSSKCTTLCTYVGPVGFPLSFQSVDVVAGSESRAGASPGKGNGGTSGSASSSSGSWNTLLRTIEDRIHDTVDVGSIETGIAQYTKEVDRFLSTIEVREGSDKVKNAHRSSFLRPFRRIHGKNAGQTSARAIAHDRLKGDLRFKQLQLKRRLEHYTDKYNSHANKTKISRLTRMLDDDEEGN